MTFFNLSSPTKTGTYGNYKLNIEITGKMDEKPMRLD